MSSHLSGSSRRETAAFKISQHDRQNVHVVTLSGPLTAVTARRARAGLTGRSWTRTTVVLDLDQLTVIDSSGLSVLASLRRHLDHDGRRLILASSTPATRRLLSVTGIDRVIETHPSAAAAIAHVVP